MTFSNDTISSAQRYTPRPTKSKYGVGRSRTVNIPQVMIDWLESVGVNDRLRTLIESDEQFVTFAKERGF